MNEFIDNYIIIDFEGIKFKCKINNIKRILTFRNI